MRKLSFVKQLCFLTFALGIIAFTSGCATIDANEAARGGSELPWNEPANWETGAFGVPY